MVILCTIDLETREVSLPAGQVIASYDHNVDVIRFQAEAIPGFSLNTSSIKIAAQGPNKARHDYAVDPSTVAIEEETGYITFDWPIPAGVTEMPLDVFKYGDKGNLIFAVCAEIISGNAVSKAWHSDDGIITVVAHLEPESGGGEDPSETATNAQKIGQLQTDMAVVQREVSAVAGGTPTVVDSKSAMTEHDKIYILSSDGKWYYYSATAEDWLVGGTYGGAVTDTTLSISGVPADAKAVGDALAEKADADDLTAVQTAVAEKADSDDVTALDTRVTAVETGLDGKADSIDVDELKNAIDELAVPLTLVATYQGKQARATGLTDSASNTVYQFQIPDNCETVHITSYFYGNSRIIFTNSATPIDFSTGQYQQYPSTGYNTPTDIDDDYATLRFKYVYVTFLVTEGKECKASCPAWDIINFIGSNTPIAENTNGNITDFNDAKRNHIYVISSGISNIQNYPPISNGGTLLCYASYNIDNVQLFVSNQMAIYMRRKWGTTWSDWKQIPTADAVQTLVNTAVNTAFSGYYPYNVLSAFKNITCIGDSLTYSQVYTGNSTSRQAYKPYPKVIADRAGATETILATPGDTATQAWDRNSENIVQKDAQLTLVYLGTNGGLTDTMDTDMVGDDYTQWADTNTGAYGKIIAKSIAVGSRVVLIKVHSSGGGVAVTNTVIEKMASRFNVPVINNTYLSGTKYHSWPNGGGTNGTHYNDFGYAVFADQIANSISQLSAEDAIKIIPE